MNGHLRRCRSALHLTLPEQAPTPEYSNTLLEWLKTPEELRLFGGQIRLRFPPMRSLEPLVDFVGRIRESTMFRRARSVEPQPGIVHHAGIAH